jgi:cysteine desulfurase family protein (TIGR01976 family)
MAQSSVIDLSFTREEFPALNAQVDGRPVCFFDGPGGTQVPKTVIDAMVQYLTFQNSNTGGAFLTSQETDRVIEDAGKAIADFLGAEPCEIAFGANMTSLNYSLSRAIGRDLGPGDEVVITDLDHEANRGPWLDLQEQGIVVKHVKVNLDDCSIDMQDFQEKVGLKTCVVAFGYASNAVGTINDTEKIIEMAKDVGAITVVDAVHYAPHGPIDARDLKCDFLLCSAYKFFGPHVGVLYGRKDAFEHLKTFRVTPQENMPPAKIETGTLNHEGLAGTVAAIDFISRIGQRYAGFGMKPPSQRELILSGMSAIEEYETLLAERLIAGLEEIPQVTVYGPSKSARRTPTVSFTVREKSPQEVAANLAEQGIFVWDGDFYATTLIKRLGLHENGGLVRIGIAPYNTREEVERLLESIRKIIRL